MRAVGDSRSPLYFLIISCVINVVLDLVFIICLGTGVEGAAIATVISQCISGVLCFLWIAKKFPMLHPHGAEWKPNAAIMARLLTISLPMGFQFSITAIGAVILQSAVNTLGSDIIASISASSKIQNIVFAPMETLGLTMATYCGQNLGAGRIDRIRLGMRRCIAVSLLLSLLCCLMVTFGGRYIALLYIKAEEVAILDNITYYLRICGIFYAPLSLIFVFRNAIQGMGYSVPAMAAGLFELAARAIVALGFVRSVGFTAAALANPMAWIAADIFLIPMYLLVIRKFTKNPPPVRQTES
jgi:Na+-driven multidrug efflux pump